MLIADSSSLRLHDVAAVSLDPAREIRHHVGRGRDRVAGVEAAARRDGAHPDGLVAVEEDVVLVSSLKS